MAGPFEGMLKLRERNLRVLRQYFHRSAVLERTGLRLSWTIIKLGKLAALYALHDKYHAREVFGPARNRPFRPDWLPAGLASPFAEGYEELAGRVLLKDTPPGLGAPIWLLEDSDVGRSLFLQGDYEEGVGQILERQIAPGDVVVDVGANIGIHTIRMSRLVGLTGSVIAVEPHPTNFAILRRNLALNGASNVHGVPIALGMAFETRFLNSGEDFAYASFYQHEGTGDTTPPVRVSSIPGDFLLRLLRVGQIRLIKVDVEGHELHVLRGLRRTIVEDRPIVIVEASDERLQHAGVRREDVFAFLRGLGYSGSRMARRARPWPEPRQTTPDSRNYCFEWTG